MTETDQATEPALEQSDNAYHRHYRITSHAIDRYIERIGGDLGNMIADLDNAWLFDTASKRLARRICACIARHERKGGWAMTNGRAIFIIMPKAHQHVIVTTLRMIYTWSK
ncbi:hypothetical protein CWK15_18135 [Salmonella enterica]|uniref:Uncharacterized protein n=1 Tax=Salmonella enterica TaxID=28901 RepID=A0A5V4Z6M4_SALER|nr:hypothetical protein [Salmonella enterica]EIU1710398.1 hypothetical protein [Salmonella enterica]